ncbi:MAG: hypothetical protein JW957_06710 [Candidatus Omnitrophica bacterium]|nr:hypothetical protein [Candidatus Omnitrophota bacterium]
MEKKKDVFGIRMIRSPWSDFYGREIEDSLKTHPDSYLEEIEAQGYNAIWLHCILRDIVASKAFPGFGKKEKEQIPALNKMVEKAAEYGLKVFLYFCEPRGFKENDAFWKNNADVKGQPADFHIKGGKTGRYLALCSSTQRVKDFLYQSSYNLFKKVPGLGGIFMITASEFHTHCYSHLPIPQKKFNEPQMEEWAKAKFTCGRCAERKPYEVVSEIITLVNKGVKDANPKADVIAWNWSWYFIEQEPQKKLISLLPQDVILMATFERGGWKHVLNKRLAVDEYSFAYTGPSPTFRDVYNEAKKRKMRMMAKIQIGTTHELVTVPYIPVPYILAEKLHRMKKTGVYGYLGCWIMGGNVSLMSRVAGKMSVNGLLSPSQAVREAAVEEFGEEASLYVTKAWKRFSSAWKTYPFSIPFLYYSPINFATVYPFDLSARSVPGIPSWLALPKDKQGHLAVGNNLKTWIKPFTAGFVIKVLKKLLSEWEKGIEALEEGAKKHRPDARYRKETDMAVHISLLIRSTINIIEFYSLLKKYAKNAPDAKKSMKKLLENELSIAEKDRDIIGRNNDFGYHSEAHEYFITAKGFDYKISLLKKQIKKLNS